MIHTADASHDPAAAPGSDDPPRQPRHLVVFGDSIRSDIGNPAATTWRALMAALIADGHRVTFIEMRRGRALEALLRIRGSAPLRAFANRHPGLIYRTVDLPHRREVGVRMAQELALADAAIVLDTAPATIIEALAAFDHPRVLRVLHLTGESERPSSANDFPIVATPVESHEHQSGSLRLGPAVMVTGRAGENREAAGTTGDTERQRIALLAWDAEESAVAAAALASLQEYGAFDVDAFSFGTLELPGFRLASEQDLIAVVSRADQLVVVTPANLAARPMLSVRPLLAAATGKPIVGCAAATRPPEARLCATPGDLPAAIRHASVVAPAGLEPWSAVAQSRALIRTIIEHLAGQQTRPGGTPK